MMGLGVGLGVGLGMGLGMGQRCMPVRYVGGWCVRDASSGVKGER